MLTLPALVALAATMVYPVAWTIWLSLNGPGTALSGAPDFKGLGNYTRIAGSAEFRAALWQTLQIVLASFVLEAVLVILLLVAVAAWISVPLRRAGAPAEPGLEDPVMAELEARKQAKYREIRDTELDHAQEKLSDEEFERQDAELRREAIAILKEIDAAEAERGGSGG